MNEKDSQACFQIDLRDNVCVALSDLEPGTVHIHGASQVRRLEIADRVKRGHKIANRAIHATEPIIKYGIAVGTALQDIPIGTWVHLHNCKSNYDERSSSLDLESGAPTDTHYD